MNWKGLLILMGFAFLFPHCGGNEPPEDPENPIIYILDPTPPSSEENEMKKDDESSLVPADLKKGLTFSEGALCPTSKT